MIGNFILIGFFLQLRCYSCLFVNYQVFSTYSSEAHLHTSILGVSRPSRCRLRVHAGLTACYVNLLDPSCFATNYQLLVFLRRKVGRVVCTKARLRGFKIFYGVGVPLPYLTKFFLEKTNLDPKTIVGETFRTYLT